MSEPKKKIVHWMGGVLTERRESVAHYPACVSGSRAYAIASEADRGTYERAAVTCSRCRAWVAKSDSYRAATARLNRIKRDAIRGDSG